MILEKAQIINFKNIGEASLDFSPSLNCIIGSNGMGKSNLLEAISFVSFLRGFRTIPDSEFMRHGSDMMIIRADYLRDDGSRDSLSAGMATGKRKSIRCNGKAYQRLTDHIGRFPVVTVTPQDSRLVQGAGDERRRLMDIVISQTDPLYLASLVKYRKAIESRNRMLRSGIHDNLLFESVEKPLCEAASDIFEARKRWVEEISPVFAARYSEIAGGSEEASLDYSSRLAESTPADLLNQTRAKDAVLGYTSSGPHRDDLEMLVDGYSVRKLGSQGQEKTFTTSLRLAIFDYLSRNTGLKPLLLLDDIFDKLDANRVESIINLVATDERFGQIFVTDTNLSHIDEIIPRSSAPLILKAENGAFTPRTANA